MMLYKLVAIHPEFSGVAQVMRTTDSAFIPFDPANTDYAEYLKWIAEGNTPEEAS